MRKIWKGGKEKQNYDPAMGRDKMWVIEIRENSESDPLNLGHSTRQSMSETAERTETVFLWVSEER